MGVFLVCCVCAAGQLLCRGVHLKGDNRVLIWLMLVQLLRCLEDPTRRCTEFANLMILYSVPLATCWARHDAIAARTDKLLPAELADFVIATSCDISNVSARVQPPTAEEMTAIAASAQRPADADHVVDVQASPSVAAAADGASAAPVPPARRTRRSSLSVGLQSAAQMARGALYTVEAALLDAFLSIRVQQLGKDVANQTMKEALAVKRLSVHSLMRFCFRWLGLILPDPVAFACVYQLLLDLLAFGEVGWRPFTLELLAGAIVHSGRVPTPSLFPQLCEQLAVAQFHTDSSAASDVARQCEGIAHLLVSRCPPADANPERVWFNFARPRSLVPQRRGADKVEYLRDGDATKHEIEREECLKRLERDTFTIVSNLVELLDKDLPLPTGLDAPEPEAAGTPVSPVRVVRHVHFQDENEAPVTQPQASTLVKTGPHAASAMTAAVAIAPAPTPMPPAAPTPPDESSAATAASSTSTNPFDDE